VTRIDEESKRSYVDIDKKSKHFMPLFHISDTVLFRWVEHSLASCILDRLVWVLEVPLQAVVEVLPAGLALQVLEAFELPAAAGHPPGVAREVSVPAALELQVAAEVCRQAAAQFLPDLLGVYQGRVASVVVSEPGVAAAPVSVDFAAQGAPHRPSAGPEQHLHKPAAFVSDAAVLLGASPTAALMVTVVL
jgi:hypothetical protein